MVTLLFLLAVALVIFSKYKYEHSNYKYEMIWAGVEFVSVAISVCLLIAVCILLFCTPGARVIDDKITTLEQENVKIEQDIDTLVTTYMEHESEVFESAKPSNSMTLVQLYPELKSNELVKSQMEVYTKNNNKIKQYKLDKSDYEVYKWLLYFGGK